MKTKWQQFATVTAVSIFGLFALAVFGEHSIGKAEFGEASPTPTPAAVPAPAFDQATAVAKLKEQIKGREQENAEKVFKNLQLPALKTMPAARILSVMEFGYARSLGVNCTHCHRPDKWEAEDKAQKQTARDMWAMMGKINGELLKNIKNLKSASPTVNCTTCHRGQIVPATNLPMPAKS